MSLQKYSAVLPSVFDPIYQPDSRFAIDDKSADRMMKFLLLTNQRVCFSDSMIVDNRPLKNLLLKPEYQRLLNSNSGQVYPSLIISMRKETGTLVDLFKQQIENNIFFMDIDCKIIDRLHKEKRVEILQGYNEYAKRYVGNLKKIDKVLNDSDGAIKDNETTPGPYKDIVFDTVNRIMHSEHHEHNDREFKQIVKIL